MNPILFFDTETTGLPDWKVPSESEHQPHIVQLAAILADQETRKTLSSINLIVKPDGWEISAEMAEIHGITQEQALAVGIPEKTVLDIFLALWNEAPRVSYNRTFDQRIIRIAAKRFCDEDTINAWADKETYYCPMLMAKPVMQIPGKKGFKNPKLADAYRHFTGKDMENAHNAMADTKACMEIYWELIKKE